MLPLYLKQFSTDEQLLINISVDTKMLLVLGNTCTCLLSLLYYWVVYFNFIDPDQLVYVAYLRLTLSYMCVILMFSTYVNEINIPLFNIMIGSH